MPLASQLNQQTIVDQTVLGIRNQMQKTQTFCLVILATIAVAFSLYYLKSVLLPFVIAIFIVIGCRPILEFVESKLKLPRLLAFVFSFLIGIWLMLAFAFLIWVSVNDLASNSNIYEKRMKAIVIWVVEHIPGKSDETLSSGNADDLPPKPESSTVESKSQSSTSAQNPTLAVKEFLNAISSYVQSQLVSFAGSLSSLFSYGVLILIFVFFLLLGNSEMGRQRTVSKREQTGILGKIEEQIRKYLLMKTVISMVTGFAFGMVLWFFGVPLAVVFGFLAFMLNYIPNIGPLIASVLPVPFLVLNSNMSPTSAIICFILIATIQFISGNVIETRIMGKSFDVSPIALLLALMFFGLVWGIIGMFLATPIVSIIKIVFQQHDSTRPIADLMAGRLDIFDSFER